jgi:hypothetical protein
MNQELIQIPHEIELKMMSKWHDHVLTAHDHEYADLCTWYAQSGWDIQYDLLRASWVMPAHQLIFFTLML